MSEQIFDKACLIQMNFSIWTASKSVDPVLMSQLGNQREWLRGRKNLINPELLGQIRTASLQARHKVRRYALPFPIHSIQLVPKEYISTIEDILQHQERVFWERVDEFVSMYHEARDEAQVALGSLFNEQDYPQNVRKKFKFEWQFLALQVPSQTTILSPDIYEREKVRFENLINETREMCMQALRAEFSGLLHELTQKLTSNGDRPKKIVANSMFNKLNQFFQEMQTKNIFEDQELISLTQNAQEIIGNVSPYNLKYNEQAREHIKSEIQSIQEALEESITDLPRRQIKMDTEAA